MPSPTTATATQRSFGWRLLTLLIKLVAALAALLIPLAGFWIASSLAAHHDHALWVSVLLGALCFPLAPALWEAWAWARRSKSKTPLLTVFDRLVLRTMGINLAFVAALLGLFPGSVFEALSTRGDWMLAGHDGPAAQRTRTVLFAAADHMQWLHDLARPNAYEDLVEPSLTETSDETPQPRPQPEPEVRPDLRPDLQPDTPTPDTPPDVTPENPEPGAVDPVLAPTLHPFVASMPDDVQGSYPQVARYIAANIPDQREQLRVLHDYVADRLAYDVVALKNLAATRQDATTVFEKKEAVCAGYAALLARMGKEIGLEIVVVVGNTREEDGRLATLGHAWNAARLDTGWVLIDATWDAGSVGDDVFTKGFGTGYFMTDPKVFGRTHLPEQERWQLRDDPLTLSAFVRQAKLNPQWAQLGLTLESPDRNTVAAAVGETLVVEVGNPQHLDIAIQLRNETERLSKCTPNATFTRFDCTIEDPRDQWVSLQGIKENVRRTASGSSWTRTVLGRISVDVN